MSFSWAPTEWRHVTPVPHYSFDIHICLGSSETGKARVIFVPLSWLPANMTQRGHWISRLVFLSQEVLMGNSRLVSFLFISRVSKRPAGFLGITLLRPAWQYSWFWIIPHTYTSLYIYILVLFYIPYEDLSLYTPDVPVGLNSVQWIFCLESFLWKGKRCAAEYLLTKCSFYVRETSSSPCSSWFRPRTWTLCELHLT